MTATMNPAMAPEQVELVRKSLTQYEEPKPRLAAHAPPCARCRKPMKVRILFPGCDLPLRGMWSRGAAISATRGLRQLAAQGATFTLLAHQLHEMSGLVDEEEVAGVVKVLTLELFRSELQLDFVVAQPASVHYAFAQVQRDLLPWSKRHHYGLR